LKKEKLILVKLGDKVKDSLTGFEGVATARTEYLYGCVHVCVTPTGLKDGKPIESQWFDEQRIDPASVAGDGGPGDHAPAREH
jgi:hypothetical protein